MDILLVGMIVVAAAFVVGRRLVGGAPKSPGAGAGCGSCGQSGCGSRSAPLVSLGRPGRCDDDAHDRRPA